MKIGIDIYSFIPDKNFGVGPTVYAYNLVKHLVEQNSGHDFVIFTNEANHIFFSPRPNCKIIKSKMPASKGILRVIHEQIVLPFYFYREKLDVIHFTGNVISFLLGRHSILTVHDLMWKYYLKSDWVPLYKKIYYSVLCPRSFKLARRIVTVSNFIKGELVFEERVRPDKIFVIHEAHGLGPEVELTPEEIRELEKEYPPGFLFSVTTTWPHKNLIVLLKALDWLQENKNFDRRLIVVGQNRLSNDEINRYLQENHLDHQFISLGFVSDKELKYFYSRAGVFIFPSLYEGFGLPLLEAMRMGVPVVASQAASLPEIGKDACLYADPHAPEDFARQIHRLLEDENLRSEMITRGKLREKQFSWDALARQTICVYEHFKK